MTLAICAFVNCPFHAGIWPLYVEPATVIFSESPYDTMWTTFVGSPEVAWPLRVKVNRSKPQH